jgi:hypothetical protein
MNIGFYIKNIEEVEKAKLLISSIQRHIKHSKIYAITKDEIHLDGCQMIYADIFEHNTLYFVDKLQAASIFESHVFAPYLWIDIDTIFLKPMKDICKEKAAICLNPVDIKNIGINENQKMSDLWLKTIEYLELKSMSHTVKTKISKESIWPYYNIGMVYVNIHRFLFGQSYQKIIELSQNESINKLIFSKPLNQIFYHQMVFSLIVEKLYYQEISELSAYVNYPLHLMEKDSHKPNPNDLISIRYDTFFKQHEVPDFLQNIVNINKKSL